MEKRKRHAELLELHGAQIALAEQGQAKARERPHIIVRTPPKPA
jgi:hypothetical protein